MELDWEAVRRYRFRRLVVDVPREPVELARAVHGLQAQVWSSTGLAAWVHTGSVGEAELRHEVEQTRRLVRTCGRRRMRTLRCSVARSSSRSRADRTQPERRSRASNPA